MSGEYTVALKELVRSTMRDVLEEKDGLKSALAAAGNHIDHVCGCPDCYCGAIEKMRKLSEVQCADCGLPLGSKDMARKIDHCPNCGGKTPKLIER